MARMSVICLRGLNRTLLARQILAERTTLSAFEVIKHLVAVQGQEPNWPYVGLWTRLADFRQDELVSLLRDRTVVRSTMLRRTVHLADADDFRWLRPTVQPIMSSALKTAFYADEIDGLDLDELARVGRELLTGALAFEPVDATFHRVPVPVVGLVELRRTSPLLPRLGQSPRRPPQPGPSAHSWAVRVSCAQRSQASGVQPRSRTKIR
jgi:hypothetical protein